MFDFLFDAYDFVSSAVDRYAETHDYNASYDPYSYSASGYTSGSSASSGSLCQTLAEKRRLEQQMYEDFYNSATERTTFTSQEADSMSTSFRFTGDIPYRGKNYHFEFQCVRTLFNGYRAYIEEAPSYGRRSDKLSATHRMRDGNRYYICWSEKIRSREKIEAVMRLWARATVMYIADGGPSLDAHAAKLMATE